MPDTTLGPDRALGVPCAWLPPANPMFGDYSRDLLRAGIIDLKAGNRKSARRYLDHCLYMSSSRDAMAEAWYSLSQTIDNIRERPQAMENCRTNDLHHTRARRALAILDGRLSPDEIIDPDLPVPAPAIPDARARRFTCAKCGRRRFFAPDRRSLVCECRRRHERLLTAVPSTSQNDFVLAMATRRGHSQTLREQARLCQGCSAEFIRPAIELSFNCPYCDSPHVIIVDATGDVVAPDGILPHDFDEHRARVLLTAWLQEQDLDSDPSKLKPRGLYLPIWTFTLGGGIDYTSETTTDANDSLWGRVADIDSRSFHLLRQFDDRILSAGLVACLDLRDSSATPPRYCIDQRADLRRGRHWPPSAREGNCWISGLARRSDRRMIPTASSRRYQ